MRKLTWILGIVALVATAAYTTISLARWEWSRALFFGLTFLAAELGMVGGAVLSRLARLERRIEADAHARAAASPSERTLDIVRRGRADHDRFPWLKVDVTDAVTRTNVFITLVVGGGVLLSGGAWVLDRIASHTVDPGRESQLADELVSIAYPDGLLVDDMVARARTRPDQEDDRLTTFLLRRP